MNLKTKNTCYIKFNNKKINHDVKINCILNNEHFQ